MNTTTRRRVRRSTLLGAAVLVSGLALIPSALANDTTHQTLAAQQLPATIAPVAQPIERCNGEVATIISNDREVFGMPSQDVIVGGTVDQRIRGYDGDDNVCGRAGNDVLFGNEGQNYLNGDEGNDIMYGGENYDRIFDPSGNDTLWGNGGADNMNGGEGIDWLYGGNDDDTMAGGLGQDTLLGEGGNDIILGGDFGYTEKDDSNNLYGGGGNDILMCGPGPDDFADGGPDYDIADSSCERVVNVESRSLLR